MSNIFSSSEVKQKSIKGTKWLFITNVFNVPGSFVLAFFLGRTSPEALGAFGLVQVFVAVITTFIVFGGQTVLRNFMAKVTEPDLRGKLFYSYSIILICLLLLMSFFFALFPTIFEFFIRQEITFLKFCFFIIFSLTVIASELFSSAIAGMMNIKTSAISQSITRLLPVPVVVFLFFFNRSFLENESWLIILSLYFISYLIGATISAKALFREEKFEFKPKKYLPKGFVPFCFTTHLASIFSFIYNDVDRIFMLQLSDIGTLGIYQSVVSINRIMDFGPQVLALALVPMFSSLLSGKYQEQIQNTYIFVQRYLSIFLISLSFFTISFSRELLMIFGSHYMSYNHILILYSLGSSICCLGVVNNTILTSYEKNYFRLSVSVIQIIIQLLGTFLFIGQFGVLAVAGFKILGRIIANILYVVYLKYCFGNLTPPKAYIIGSLLCIIVSLSRIYIIPYGFLYSLALFGLSFLTFIYWSRLSLGEIKKFLNLFFNRY